MILGASKLQIPAIRKARDMGVYTIVLDINPNAEGLKLADHFELVSTIDTAKVLESAKRNNINGIMTIASDRPMNTIASVSKTLGLTSISEDTALKATNKFHMRNALKKSEVPIPFYFYAKSLDYVLGNIELLKFPMIIKPDDNSGSRGITLVEKFDLKNITNAFDYAQKNSINGGVLFEEYMQGPEVSVESITIDCKTYVLAITDKITTGSPHFVELGHSQPSILSENIRKAISDITIKTINAIGITNGPSHTEIIVTNEGPKVVEIGARMGGDYITSHLVPLSTGIDMLEAVINLTIGNYPNIIPKFSNGSSIKYFNFRQGKVHNIYDKITETDMKNLVEYNINVSIGDTIKPIENSSGRYGHVICRGETVFEAQEYTSKYIEKIIIEYT